MKVVIYLRKSFIEDQRGMGEPFHDQKKTLLALAKQKNFNVVKIYEEIDIGDCPNYLPLRKQLLREVRNGLYDAVLCTGLDQFGRGNMHDLALVLNILKDNKTKLITPRQIFDLEVELSEKRNKDSTQQEVTNPLADLIICEKCGETMLSRPYAIQPPQLICSNQHCDIKGAPLDRVEEKVLTTLRDWVEKYELDIEASILPNQLSANMEGIESRIRSLKHVLMKMEKQCKALLKRFTKGMIDKTTFQEKETKFAKRKAIAQKTLTQYQQQLDQQQRMMSKHHNLIPKIKSVLTKYPTLNNPKEKNALLKEVLEKCLYMRTKEQSYSEFTIKIYPRL